MSLREAMSRTLLLARDGIIVGDNTPTDEQLIAAFRGTRVLVVADEANLSAAAAQHALVTLVNLVARLGVDLRVALPDVPVLGYQPPLRQEHLRSGVLELGADLLPGCSVELAEADESVDLAFILGDATWIGEANFAVRLCGDAWAGWTVPASVKGRRWTDTFPMGALTAAGIAAPEVFKYALRTLDGQLPYPLEPRFLAPVHAAHVQVAPHETPTDAFDLGMLDMVSGGAISHAALYTLLHLPRVTADIRLIEPERSDLSNLNRYMLLRRSECGQLKIETLASWQHADLHMRGVAHAYSASTAQDLRPLAPQVLVGVDDIPTRWLVQEAWPEWLGIGATSHFLAITSSHAMGQPCAGCLHPVDDPGPALIPTVSFVSYWAGVLLATRLLRSWLGLLQNGNEQCLECYPMRLDQLRAFWPKPVAPNPRCPVRCPAAISC